LKPEGRLNSGFIHRVFGQNRHIMEDINVSISKSVTVHNIIAKYANIIKAAYGMSNFQGFMAKKILYPAISREIDG